MVSFLTKKNKPVFAFDSMQNNPEVEYSYTYFKIKLTQGLRKEDWSHFLKKWSFFFLDFQRPFLTTAHIAVSGILSSTRYSPANIVQWQKILGHWHVSLWGRTWPVLWCILFIFNYVFHNIWQFPSGVHIKKHLLYLLQKVPFLYHSKIWLWRWISWHMWKTYHG